MRSNERRDKSVAQIARQTHTSMPAVVDGARAAGWAPALDRRRPMVKVSIGTCSRLTWQAVVRPRRPDSGFLDIGTHRPPTRDSVHGGFEPCYDFEASETPDQEKIFTLSKLRLFKSARSIDDLAT